MSASEGTGRQGTVLGETMAGQEDDGRKAQAAKWREEIEKLRRRKDERSQESESTEPARPITPREFIHERMRELDKKRDA